MIKQAVIFFCYLVMVSPIYATPLKIQSLDVVDEAVLLSCQSLGHSLYMECIKKLPILPKEIAACVSLKTAYLLCLHKLTAPYPVLHSLDPDPYGSNPFTPCDSETAHLILFDICPSIP